MKSLTMECMGIRSNEIPQLTKGTYVPLGLYSFYLVLEEICEEDIVSCSSLKCVINLVLR